MQERCGALVSSCSCEDSVNIARLGKCCSGKKHVIDPASVRRMEDALIRFLHIFLSMISISSQENVNHRFKLTCKSQCRDVDQDWSSWDTPKK